MKTESVKIELIKPNPNNPRVIKDKKFKLLVKSIKEFPAMLNLRPIVVNKDMVILGGNMRHKACVEAGLTKLPVIIAADLTPEQEKEFVIKDNTSGGEWDFQMLENGDWNEELLVEWGMDLPADFGIKPEAQEDGFEAPEGGTETDIILGDIFEIGDHRLVCGSSTEADVVAKVLNGKEPYLMVTDPPYGVEYDPDWRNHAARKSESMGNRKIGAGAVGEVMNDDNADWTLAWALSPSKVAYVYHAGKFSGIVQQSLENCDFQIRSQIIWAKSNFAISRGDYHWKHEPCWYAVKKGSKGNWAGDRKQTTVWEIDKPQKSETGHGTQKPVECMSRGIGNHDGDVYEPFAGSGTTMVAAHQLGRKCYAIELNPKYCQVIIDRMKILVPGIKITKNGGKI